MVDKQATKPPGSQMSGSDLSDPPNIKSDEEYRDIEAKFAVTPLTPIPQIREPTAAEDGTVILPVGHSSSPSSPRPKRSTRGKRPVRYSASSDDDELDDVEEGEIVETSHKRVPVKRSSPHDSPDAAAKKPPAKRARPTPRGRKSKWDPKYVTENEKSPLVNVDLRSLLLQPAAWDCLTDEDKKEILALMPDKTHILNSGTPDARPNFQSLRNDDNFRHDCDQYVANLSNGMHDPTWLKDAWIAHGRRNAGQFDEFHIRKLELEWGATIPEQHKPAHLRSQEQTGEPSASTGPQPTNNNNQAAESQPKKPENSTSQRFVVNANGNGKAAGKGKGAAGGRRSGKGANKVTSATVNKTDGGGDSTDVAAGNTDKASSGGPHDAKTETLPTGDVQDEKRENNAQADEGCRSDRDGRAMALAKLDGVGGGGGGGGDKSQNVGEPSSAEGVDDVDMSGG